MSIKFPCTKTPKAADTASAGMATRLQGKARHNRTRQPRNAAFCCRILTPPRHSLPKTVMCSPNALYLSHYARPRKRTAKRDSREESTILFGVSSLNFGYLYFCGNSKSVGKQRRQSSKNICMPPLNFGYLDTYGGLICVGKQRKRISTKFWHNFA